MKKCIYTVITGNYDDIKEPTVITKGWDYICYTNNPKIKSKVWKVKQIYNKGLDNAKLSRKIWLLFHEYVGEYDLSIMIGGQLEIRCDLDKFVKRFLHKDVDMALMKHPSRNCIYDEAIKCSSKNLDDPIIIQAQMTFYRTEGYPANNGLVACGIMIRRHHIRNLELHFEHVWENVRKWSFRDQLSFNYIDWKYKLIKYNLFPYDVLHGKYFKRKNHKGMKR